MSTELREKWVELTGLGIRSRVLEAGAGPLVVLLHGHPDNAEGWAPLMRRLAARFRCIAPDLPGYGKSPEPPPSFAYSRAGGTSFVDAVLEAAGVREKFILVVHDTGGIIGVPWAARNMARLNGLMITNTVAYEGFPWFPVVRMWGNPSSLARLRSHLGFFALRLRGGGLFKKVFWGESPQLDEADVDRVTRSFALNRDATRSTLRQFTEVVKPDFFDGYDEMMRTITARIPTRVLWGDKDPYLPVKYAKRFASAHVTVLPEAGHWVALTASAELAEEIALLGQSRS